MHGKRKIESPILQPTPGEAPGDPDPRCDHPGCDRAGEFRAPKARDRLHDYYRFCLDHVRAYNKAWDYCAGMSEDELEAMVRTDTCWQRPSWPLGGWGAAEARLRDTLDQEFAAAGGPEGRNGRGNGHAHGGNGEANGRSFRPRSEEEQALHALDLTGPVDFATIKARYKTLVKQHHPDANGGSREAEEKLKAINRAYGTLKASYAPS